MNNVAEKLRHISQQDLAAIGMQQLAYIRPAVVNGVTAFTIHAADGTQIGIAPNHDVAVAAVIQHELEPLSLH
jgi:hypothetical protein